MSIAGLVAAYKLRSYIRYMAKERKFTEAQRVAAFNLDKLWDEKQRAKGFSQTKAANDLGWTQGTIHQYVRGKLPLNPVAILKFAQYLDVYPTDIDPTIIKLLVKPKHLVLIELFEKMTGKKQDAWKRTGDALAESDDRVKDTGELEP